MMVRVCGHGSIRKSLALLICLALAAGGAPTDDAAAAYGTHRFTFDAVHGPEAEQEAVYEVSARPAVAASSRPATCTTARGVGSTQSTRMPWRALSPTSNDTSSPAPAHSATRRDPTSCGQYHHPPDRVPNRSSGTAPRST